jgi:hypothetical protein
MYSMHKIAYYKIYGPDNVPLHPIVTLLEVSQFRMCYKV